MPWWSVLPARAVLACMFGSALAGKNQSGPRKRDTSRSRLMEWVDGD
jgi:hypothetical protein